MIPSKNFKYRAWDLVSQSMFYISGLKSFKDYNDIKFSLMNYIGEKNNFSLYEFDIFKYKYKHFSYGDTYETTGIIVWDEKRCGWCFSKIYDNYKLNLGPLITDYWLDIIRYCGNIYEDDLKQIDFSTKTIPINP